MPETPTTKTPTTTCYSKRVETEIERLEHLPIDPQTDELRAIAAELRGMEGFMQMLMDHLFDCENCRRCLEDDNPEFVAALRVSLAADRTIN